MFETLPASCTIPLSRQRKDRSPITCRIVYNTSQHQAKDADGFQLHVITIQDVLSDVCADYLLTFVPVNVTLLIGHSSRKKYFVGRSDLFVFAGHAHGFSSWRSLNVEQIFGGYVLIYSFFTRRKDLKSISVLLLARFQKRAIVLSLKLLLRDWLLMSNFLALWFKDVSVVIIIFFPSIRTF